ncbi:MAG: agmatine deiminase family protein [Planctomycetaceae bacterium]|nr:agmatine deiminase family protein [Planctomycetaceae bacterium]
MPDTPAQLGYRWPAEWEPQASVWLSWPRNPDTWPGHFEPVPGEFAQFVRLIAEYEPVNILAGGAEVMAQALALVGDLANVTLHDIATNDAWCRDHGPTFLQPIRADGKGSGFRVQESKVGGQRSDVGDTSENETSGPRSVLSTQYLVPSTESANREHSQAPRPRPLAPSPQSLAPALVNWDYNAWGGKYPPFELDNQVPLRIAEIQRRRVFTPGIVMEGGAIEGNGRGTILTTESCLLNPNRNANLSREDVERYLRDYLGAKKILWLAGGEIAGDDTDGHIDQIARFVNPTTLVCSICDDSADENYGPTQQNLVELQVMSDQDDRPLEVIPLRLPRALFCDGQRLPAGYANFLIVNGAVIVPQFGDPADDEALRTLAPLFPDRDVRGCPSLHLIWGLGSFHCLSQQEPLA